MYAKRHHVVPVLLSALLLGVLGADVPIGAAGGPPDQTASQSGQDVKFQSDDGVWQIVGQRTSQDLPQQRVVSGPHVVVWLNQGFLDMALRRAPREVPGRVTASAATLDLPMPDGTFARFLIEESPILAPHLAAAFPEIRTYRAQQVDHPATTARFGWTAAGFHATIYAEGGSIYIDPVAAGDITTYVSYRRADYSRPAERIEYPFENPLGRPQHRIEDTFPISNGDMLRTYRLALAATAEYTAAAGGTKDLALARMTTTMNRVNGIYERDLAVRLEVMTGTPGDPTALIYTDAGSDPYTNTSTVTMIGENQTNLDAVIGPGNYDLGHVFATSAGGVSYLGIVCVDPYKAGGVTGTSNPTGDAFDVDYVAHEMGHQFNAQHTYNGTAGSCGPERAPTHAYEVGSGVTIMGYAGICLAENLQRNSIDHFHVESIDQMTAYVTSGDGASCGAVTGSGNTPPTVNADGPYTIPQQTPFMLTASGSDPNGDSLTYSWEQFDLGTASSNAATASTDDGSRPLFRPYSPTSNASRLFPSATYILNNANTPPTTYTCSGYTCLTGETLPSTNRTMNFQVTARDNRAGGGGVGTGSAQVTVTTAAGPFRVTAPNTAVSVAGGSAVNVTWNVAGTDGAPVNAANVQISLSTDGGTTFPTVLVASTPNDGSHTLNLPNTPTAMARILVQAVGNIFFDVSDTNFTITSGATLPTLTPSPAVLNIGAVNNGGTLTSATPAQTVTVSQSSGAGVAWTASANVSWLTIAAADAVGTGSGSFTVTLNNTGNVLPGAGTVNGTITLNAPGAQTNPTIPVRATIYAPGGSLPPFGLTSSPDQNAAGVQGAVGITGWVLDDVGIERVRLYRNCLGFEDQNACQVVAGQNVVWMGDATLVAGARPDIEGAYPAYPQNNRAGFGYAMLSNLSPHIPLQQMFGGQGPLTIYIRARDIEGNEAWVGRNFAGGTTTLSDEVPTAITMANDTIAKPFGTIDTPTQGQTVSGAFWNWGWALTPDSNAIAGDAGDILIPTNGTTITVWIDGAARGTVTYNQCRGAMAPYCIDDIASIFGNLTPQPIGTPRANNPTEFRNLDANRGAIGGFFLNTAAYTNAVHTIAWAAYDNATPLARGDGLGSRYFTVLNVGAGDRGSGTGSVTLSRREITDPRSPVPGPGLAADVLARTGFSLDAPFVELQPDADGMRHVQLDEMGRLELQFGPAVGAGSLVVNDEYRPLPVGSQFDAETGTFTWAPGVGFIGTYRLAFGSPRAEDSRSRAGVVPELSRTTPALERESLAVVDVTIRPVTPPAPGDAAIRIALDTPQPGATVTGSFLVAGWALDPQAAMGSGIGAVHVWAQRRDVAGAAPVFLGVAVLGGARPDVGGIHGPQFAGAGYNLASPALPPGLYDVTTYVWATRSARWEDARTVTITVR